MSRRQARSSVRIASYVENGCSRPRALSPRTRAANRPRCWRRSPGCRSLEQPDYSRADKAAIGELLGELGLACSEVSDGCSCGAAVGRQFAVTATAR